MRVLQEMAKSKGSGKVNAGLEKSTVGSSVPREDYWVEKYVPRSEDSRTTGQVNGVARKVNDRAIHVPQVETTRTVGRDYTYRGSRLHVPRVGILCTADRAITYRGSGYYEPRSTQSRDLLRPRSTQAAIHSGRDLLRPRSTQAATHSGRDLLRPRSTQAAIHSGRDLLRPRSTQAAIHSGRDRY
jgi:hypothetical protein